MVDESAVPRILMIAGPNGAGKTTLTPRILRKVYGISDWVNADIIAQGLSGLRSETVAWQAGRVMIERLRELAFQHQSFAFETTLAGRSYAAWIAQQVAANYELHLYYVTVLSADICVARVARRVQAGGHHIPEDVIRRRYTASIQNFFELYRPMASSWTIYDNSSKQSPTLVATGAYDETLVVADHTVWNRLLGAYHDRQA
jgi:predicted ABC-type ATPase